MDDLVERFSRLKLDAVVAIENLDWATAENKLIACKAIMDLSPSRSAKDGLEMDFREVDKLLTIVRSKKSAASGLNSLQYAKVQFNATDVDDDCY